MGGASAPIGIAIFTILGFISAMFSVTIIASGVVSGLISSNKMMALIGGVLALCATWLLKPALFIVLDGVALAMNVVWISVAGAVWTVATQIVWSRFRSTDKRIS